MYAAPSGQPQNVIGTTINSTSIHIQWREVNCIERNGEILAYNVTYRAVHYPQPSLSLVTLPKERSLTLNNLIPHTNYSLLVAAQNINGTGPSKEVVVNTSGVEGKFKLIAIIKFRIYENSLLQGVMLFHNGSFHPNNSIININDIGEGTVGLLCFTNKLDCCEEIQPISRRSGEWYFPNGSALEKENIGGAMYRNRGPSVVRLNQKNTFVSPPGIFSCEITMKNGTNQSLYAGIYPINRGKRNDIVCALL